MTKKEKTKRDRGFGGGLTLRVYDSDSVRADRDPAPTEARARKGWGKDIDNTFWSPVWKTPSSLVPVP